MIAVAELTRCCETRGLPLTAATKSSLVAACQAILEGYAAGTRHGIQLDDDGLLAAGEPGQQLTWMDAKIGDWVVTLRIGKPVEVQALWLNALAFGSRWSARWQAVEERGRISFEQRFWNEAAGMLYDVIDVDHQPGKLDAALRPNQVLAVGGLPRGLLSAERARRVIDCVVAELWTPLGLRSLGRHEPGYIASYRGGPRERDASYHQGPVWLWLLGPFVEGYLRVHGDDRSARLQARERFLAPVLRELARSFGHLPELTDAEAPFALRGCPFQAWSLGEALRLHLDVLRPERPSPG